MQNLRPLLSVNSIPVISNLVSNLLYDIIEVMKSKILPLRLQTGFCLVCGSLRPCSQVSRGALGLLKYDGSGLTRALVDRFCVVGDVHVSFFERFHLPSEVVFDVRQERARFPNLFSGHVLVPRFDSIGNLLEAFVTHGGLVGGHPGPRKKADEHSSTR